MSRALIQIKDGADRLRAAEWLSKAPLNTVIEFRRARRTTEQNDRMWAMLTDVAEQKQLHGKSYKPDQWKVIFMQALGHEMGIAPTLDGTTWFPLGYSSSKLTKEEMSALIDFMHAWGAENGVTFNDGET